MIASQLKNGARQLCPPLLWNLLRRTFRLPPPPPPLAAPPPAPMRVLRTIEELDQEIARADRAGATSDDELRRVLASFRYEPDQPMPSDPFSPEYARAQMELYRHVSGRPAYDADTCEMTPFDLAEVIERPFPYSTRSSATVGEQLMAIGFLIRALALTPGDRILEFGPGWGKTTTELAAMGYDVTAVDVNPRFLDLIAARCDRLRLPVRTACADMLRYGGERFDRVLFYECFHHCSDHVAMVRRLDGLVRDGGAVVFAGEPIAKELPYPWGLRLDGMSAWSIRKFGWLELGFQPRYFTDLLSRHGWDVETLEAGNSAMLRVFVARRRADAAMRRAA
jgi:2-polyprenyl-3-methyl-5-hydroxy-6-metoxy-1,4-benzoquinol methylase